MQTHKSVLLFLSSICRSFRWCKAAVKCCQNNVSSKGDVCMQGSARTQYDDRFIGMLRLEFTVLMLKRHRQRRDCRVIELLQIGY